MTLALSFAATAISALAIILLGIVDPKRRRASRVPMLDAPPRRWLVLVALGPGIVLAWLGQWAGVLIWLGGASVIGWAVATSLAAGKARRA